MVISTLICSLFLFPNTEPVFRIDQESSKHTVGFDLEEAFRRSHRVVLDNAHISKNQSTYETLYGGKVDVFVHATSSFVSLSYGKVSASFSKSSFLFDHFEDRTLIEEKLDPSKVVRTEVQEQLALKMTDTLWPIGRSVVSWPEIFTAFGTKQFGQYEDPMAVQMYFSPTYGHLRYFHQSPRSMRDYSLAEVEPIPVSEAKETAIRTFLSYKLPNFPTKIVHQGTFLTMPTSPWEGGCPPDILAEFRSGKAIPIQRFRIFDPTTKTASGSPVYFFTIDVCARTGRHAGTFFLGPFIGKTTKEAWTPTLTDVQVPGEAKLGKLAPLQEANLKSEEEAKAVFVACGDDLVPGKWYATSKLVILDVNGKLHCFRTSQEQTAAFDKQVKNHGTLEIVHPKKQTT